MPARDGAAIRKERLKELMELIEKHEKDPLTNKDKIIGIFMLRTGNTPERINEYLEELVRYEMVLQEGDKLYTKKAWD